MEYTPSNLLRRITTPGQGYSEFHYGIDRQRVIRRDGNQAGVSRRVHYNGIIHMNGRIYDPHLARFLQADPFVEDPGTLNRYTYVHNNPLVYYDPSGYFSLKSFLKIGAAVAISFLGGQIIAGKIWASLGIKAGSAAAYGVAAAAGALSGYIMTGSLEGTLWGAFSAVTFYGIGQKFGSSLGDGKGVMGSGYSKAELARATVAHGVAGGTLSKLQGGRFGHGLASAGITKVASPAIEFAANDNSFAEVTMATIAGGSISSISGGKFANGAVTATMAYAFNQVASSQRQEGGTKFSERAEIYADMQAQLDEAGIDTVWFGAAADLNEFFASRPYMPSFMDDLGEFLLDHNRSMFQQVISGALAVDGQALDNLLVQREQMLAQSFLSDRFGSSVPALVRGPTNLHFRVGRRTMPIRVQRGIGSVETTFNQRFNFWDTAHRVHLGEAIMSQRRHGM